MDLNGEFQVELKLSSVESYFEKDIFFPKNISSKMREQDPNVSNSVMQNSSAFQFGPFSWNLAVKPQISLTWRPQDEPSISVCLSRKFRPNSQSLLCRLCYSVSAGVGDKRKSSDKRDDMIGPLEAGQPWSPQGKVADFYVRQLKDGGLVRVRVDLFSAAPMTEFITTPAEPNAGLDGDGQVMDGNRSNQSDSGGVVVGMDADVCNWAIEPDLHSSFVRFSLLFMDINKIPRNHLR